MFLAFHLMIPTKQVNRPKKNIDHAAYMREAMLVSMFSNLSLGATAESHWQMTLSHCGFVLKTQHCKNVYNAWSANSYLNVMNVCYIISVSLQYVLCSAVDQWSSSHCLATVSSSFRFLRRGRVQSVVYSGIQYGFILITDRRWWRNSDDWTCCTAPLQSYSNM